MKKILLPFLFLAFISCNQSSVDKKPIGEPVKQPTSDKIESDNFGIVIHGGAGTILKENMTDSLEAEYKMVLEEAVRAGHEILANGGSSLEAVQVSINIMENSPLFNAGKGAVFTSEGTNEMDAAIMDGETRNAGAVAGVTTVKNPINLAYEVMENSPHDFIINFQPRDLIKFEGFVHRTFNYTDLIYFLYSLQNIYKKHHGLEKAFSIDKNQTAFDAINQFRKIFFEIEYPERTSKHISNPLKNSSAKRINMSIRVIKMVMN